MSQVISPGQSNNDDLGTILRAVNMAADFYKVKLDSNRQKVLDERAAKLAEAQAADDRRKAAGILNTGEQNSIFASGKFLPAKEGDPQSVMLGRREENNAPIFGLPTGIKEAEIAAGVKREELQAQKTEKQKQKLSEIQKEFEQKPVYKENEEKLGIANEVEILLNTNNPIADGIARMKVARIANGVGVLTDKDVDRVGGSQDLISNAKRIAQKFKDGTPLLEIDRQHLREVTDAFRKKAMYDLEKAGERFAEQKSSYVDMTKKDILDSFNIGSLSEKMTPSDGTQQAQGGVSSQTQRAADAVKRARAEAAQAGIGKDNPQYRDLIKQLTNQYLNESQQSGTAGR